MARHRWPFPPVRPTSIHDAIQFADKQHVKIVIMGPRELGKVGPELKAHNIPVILGRVLALPEHEDDSYDAAMALPIEFYKAGVKFALRNVHQRVRAQPAFPGRRRGSASVCRRTKP